MCVDQLLALPGFAKKVYVMLNMVRNMIRTKIYSLSFSKIKLLITFKVCFFVKLCIFAQVFVIFVLGFH